MKLSKVCSRAQRMTHSAIKRFNIPFQRSPSFDDALKSATRSESQTEDAVAAATHALRRIGIVR